MGLDALLVEVVHGRHVAGHGEHALGGRLAPFVLVAVEGVGQVVEEPGEGLGELVADVPDPRRGEHDRDTLAVHLDRVVRVVALDERTGAADGHLIEDVEEGLGGQVLGILGHGLAEVLAHGRHAHVGEFGVGSDEESQQVVEVHEAVVHRGCGDHHDLLGRGAGQQPPEGLGAQGRGVAQVVGLVDDNK